MKKEIDNVFLYLLLILLLWVFCFVSLKLVLLPYSIAFAETGKMTFGYLCYATIGVLFSTPAPFISVLIISLFKEKVTVREFIKRIFKTENKTKTTIITSGMCLLILVYALINGKPNGSPWYMLPVGFIIMIPFVGIAEETGWRGLLQPELDKKFKFPFSVLIVALIWYVWHLDLWFDPTSNHYGDSLVGFGITIIIWSFALAALYKSTKSVFACAVYHAFIDAVGAVYDWNALFDTFPGSITTNIFRVVWLISSILLWVLPDSKS